MFSLIMWYCHRSRSEKWKNGAMASKPVAPIECSRKRSSSNLAATSGSGSTGNPPSHQQNALGLDRQLEPQAEQAQHVHHHGRWKALGQLPEVASDPARRDGSCVDELEQLLVGVKAGAQPVTGAQLREVEHGDEEQGNHDQQHHGRGVGDRKK